MFRTCLCGENTIVGRYIDNHIIVMEAEPVTDGGAVLKGDVAAWFERGRFNNATHMLVVVDKFDHEDFPVYVAAGEDAHQRFHQYAHKEWTNVMEVYDLGMDRDAQLAEQRAWHLPADTEATR